MFVYRVIQPLYKGVRLFGGECVPCEAPVGSFAARCPYDRLGDWWMVTPDGFTWLATPGHNPLPIPGDKVLLGEVKDA